MIKRIALIISVLLLLLSPSLVAAEAGITIIASDVEINFPSQAVFTLEAESSADIADVRLYYQVDKMNYVEVVSEGWADFTPANKVTARWVWDMRQASLPAGAEVTYWWVVEDAEGNKLKTSPLIIHFDDDRLSWRSLTSTVPQGGGELTLFWYEGSDFFAQELMNACEKGLARLTEDIGTYPERPIKIYIYASTTDLQEAMIFPQEWTGGVAFTEFSTIAIGISAARLDWGKRALVHELTHLLFIRQLSAPMDSFLSGWTKDWLCIMKANLSLNIAPAWKRLSWKISLFLCAACVAPFLPSLKKLTSPMLRAIALWSISWTITDRTGCSIC